MEFHLGLTVEIDMNLEDKKDRFLSKNQIHLKKKINLIINEKRNYHLIYVHFFNWI